MIVRDAILSDEPYTVASSSSQPGMIRDVARPVPAHRPSPTLVAVERPAMLDSPATAESALTLASVSAWLGKQTPDVLRQLPTVAAELEELREDAHAAGLDSGRIEGRTLAGQEAAQLHELLRGVIEAVRADCLQQQERLAAQCVDIVAAAIAQIAGPLLATREAAIGAVAAALSKAKASAELTVRVNPAQLSLLETQRAQLAAIAATSLQLLADGQVALGGCLIESPGGTLDARLEVQLQGLFDTLRIAQAEEAGT